MPRAITAADSLRTFKKKLREFFFESFKVSYERYLLMFVSIIIILTFRYFIQYFKPTLWIINILSNSLELLLQQNSNAKSYDNTAFSTCTPRLWNSIPLDLRISNSVCTFKNI